jgi:ArsR family transcriptional regulator
VCDLGCGTGRISELVAPFVERVIGIDASEAMIAAAKTRLHAQKNVEFHHAQLQALPLEERCADIALLVLVMHYVSDPPGVLAEAARVLKPGGKLLIVDMQPHAQEEYRVQMGQLWQGFEASRIDAWLRGAGFAPQRYAELPPDPAAKGPPLFVSSAHNKPRQPASKRYLLLGGEHSSSPVTID